MTTEPQDGATVTATEPEAARAFVCTYLAEAFGYPDSETLIGIRAGAADLAFALDALGIDGDPRVLTERAAALEKRLAELQGVHNALFATTLAAPASETAYELDKSVRRAVELADVEGFYRAFGVRIAEPVEPDGLVAELEFLGMLAHKGLHARLAGETEGAEVCDSAYRAFLTDHLGRWYRPFVERLNEATDEPYYLELARLLVAFLDAEVARLPARPETLSGRPVDPTQGATWPCGAGPGAGACPYAGGSA